MSWPVLPLGKVATINRAGIQPEAILSGTLYVGLENIESGGKLVDIREIDAGELASAKFVFTDQHLLFGKLRPYLRKVARPAFGGICSTDILPISVGPKLDRNYLHHFLLLDSSVEFAATRSTGANLPRISPTVLATLPVPVPPLEEQRRIAAILDQAEALRAKRRQALAKLDTLTQSLFLEMFGDQIRDTTTHIALGEVSTRITDGTHQPPKWSVEGHPFLFVSNIVGGCIDFHTSKFISDATYEELTRTRPVEVGDVLYTTVGSYGNAALVTDNRKFSFQRHIAQIKPKRVVLNPAFLAAMMNSAFVRRQADQLVRGMAQKTLNLNALRSIQVITPPLAQQNAFLDRLEHLEVLSDEMNASQLRVDILSASLQHRAFRGEL